MTNNYSWYKWTCQNIFVLQYFFMEPFPCSMKAFNNELHVFLHLNKLTNIKKKKKKHSAPSIYWLMEVKYNMVKVNKIDRFLLTNEKQLRDFNGWMDIAGKFATSLQLPFNHLPYLMVEGLLQTRQIRNQGFLVVKFK
jgi:hypothetical protein